MKVLQRDGQEYMPPYGPCPLRVGRLKSGPLSAALRAWVYARDGHRCVFCGSAGPLQLDHVHPRALGGGNMPSNLRTTCGPCNIAQWQGFAWYATGQGQYA